MAFLADPEWNRTAFKTWLRLYDMKITFIKANGEERVMTCTLRPDVLPSKELYTEETVEGSSEAITVWDLEKKAWRCFKPSTVTESTILYGEGFDG